MATIIYQLPVSCSACSHVFNIPLDIRRVTTGGELDVLRLAPDGQIELDFVELGELPTKCPSCEEPFS